MPVPTTLEEVVRLAIEQSASDVHLEPRVPLTFRSNGTLKKQGAPIDAATTRMIAERLLTDEEWKAFYERGSFDLSQTVAGVPCRMNILRSDRGIGFAIRVLSTAVSSLANRNLHPSLGDLIERDSGLILLTGPTGSGKSTTLSALIEEINQRHARHIITLESPIEYRITPKKSIVRQREVGLHTPSFEQGLLDSLREDPDVLVVGEMREPEAMRLTLNAAETGHLVLATLHSSNAAEAVYRMMMSFPPERQSSVLAQLADTLIAIVSQKMTHRADLGLNVPVCEILMGTHATRNVIRKAEVSKIPSLLQTGGQEGMWTYERYQTWLDVKTDWVKPEPPMITPQPAESPEQNTRAEVIERPAPPPAGPKPTYRPAYRGSTHDGANKATIDTQVKVHKDGRIEIPEMDLDLDDLVKQFKDKGER